MVKGWGLAPQEPGVELLSAKLQFTPREVVTCGRCGASCLVSPVASLWSASTKHAFITAAGGKEPELFYFRFTPAPLACASRLEDGSQRAAGPAPVVGGCKPGPGRSVLRSTPGGSLSLQRTLELITIAPTVHRRRSYLLEAEEPLPPGRALLARWWSHQEAPPRPSWGILASLVAHLPEALPAYLSNRATCCVNYYNCWGAQWPLASVLAHNDSRSCIRASENFPSRQFNE